MFVFLRLTNKMKILLVWTTAVSLIIYQTVFQPPCTYTPQALVK